MNVTKSNVSLAEVIETVHAYTTASVLKVLAADLQAQLARFEEACTEKEDMMAEGAAAYIRELSKRLGPRVLN